MPDEETKTVQVQSEGPKKVDAQKLIDYLKAKWGGKTCPMCGKGPWTVQDSVFALIEFSGGNIVIGGPLIPVVPVTCSNCGHTVLVNAIVSAMLPASSPPSKGESK